MRTLTNMRTTNLTHAKTQDRDSKIFFLSVLKVDLKRNNAQRLNHPISREDAHVCLLATVPGPLELSA